MEKIENLEIILVFYKENPLKAIQNLNKIYSNHQQNLSNKNKYNNDIKKNIYKKISDQNKENDYNNVPKNQRILTKKSIRKLNITFKYILSFSLSSLFTLVVFVILIIYWNNYFSLSTNLYILIDKNASLESSIYRALNIYDLMIFNNYTVKEVAQIYLNDNLKNEENALFKSFYEDLKFAFNSKIEKQKLGQLYKDFESTLNFTCGNLFELNVKYIKEIENYTESKDLKDIKGNLIKLCENSRIDDSNDYITVFERHFQYIKNGMVALTDHSYIGLLEHIMNFGTISKMSAFFNCLLIYLLEITNFEPHKTSVNNLLKKLKISILITEIIFLFIDIVLINAIIFIFINDIKNYCKQIFLLRKIFKVYEIHDQ